MDNKWTLGASALAAIGASLCCVALLVLVTLGLGGAWLSTLTQFEPVRPVLAAQQIVTLAVPGMTCAACPITVKKSADPDRRRYSC